VTDRVSKIILRGDISDLQAKMVAAGKSVRDFGDRVTDQDKKSQKFRQGLTSVGDAAGKMGLVAAAGLGAIVAVTANFDKQMSAVKAATHESADAMDALRQAAIKAGADTAFSASEAAQGIENLAKAGVQTSDILGGGLQGALDLAAAGTIDVGDAAETAATAMSQFGLSGKDVPHIADLLAAAAGKAQGEVSDMSQALNQVGLVANQTGLSIEETTGGLGAFAHAGLLGSDAGTSFKTMLLALVPKSEEAGKLMESLGFSAFDAQGNFVGLAETAQRLQDALKGMTAEQRQSYLQTIFGTDAIRSANVLYEQGATGIQSWIDKVNDQGYAAETAATKLDNLSGDMEAFKGSLETALIGSGEGSQGALRGLVQGATDAVNAFNKIPPGAQNVTTALLGITAITGGGLWFTAKTINGVSSMRTALDNLGPAGTRAKSALGGVAKSAGIVATAMIGISAAAAVLQRGGDLKLPGVNELTNQLNDLAASGTADALTKQLGDLGSAIDTLDHRNGITKFSTKFNSVFGVRDTDKDEATQRVQALDNALASMVSSGHADAAAAAIKNLATAQGLSKADTDDLLGLLPGYRDALAGAGGAADDAAGATGDLTKATGGLTTENDKNTDSTDKNTKAIEKNVKAMQDRYNAAVSAFDAETAYHNALDEGTKREEEAAALRKQITDTRTSGASDRADLQRQLGGTKDASQRASIQAQIAQSYKDEADKVADLQKQLGEYAKTLDVTTVAGRANRDILSDMAKGWNGLSNKQKNAKGAYADARQALIKQAEQFGATRKEAKRYADKLLQIPPRVQTQIKLDKKQAQAELDAWLADIAAHGFRTPRQKARDDRAANLLGLPGHADGGYISGPGSGTSDSIPAYLSNGEFVIRAAAVDRYGVDFLHTLNRMRFAQGGYVDQRAQRAQTRGYAAGGYVSGGGVSIDYDRLSAAMLSARPLYGHQTVMPHNYSEFRRQQDADQRAAEMGAVTFRAS